MDYLYRYDQWSSHIQLEGDMLRARWWSLKHKNSHPHASLMARELTLAETDAIYRISFWKTERDLYRWVAPRLRHELKVLQRVRADHSFFLDYLREDDDCLAESAWLFWNVRPRVKGNDWSLQGIPKSDIEVLDFDGAWKAYAASDIMAPTDSGMELSGFQAHRYALVARTVTAYYASKQLEIDGASVFTILITHAPQEVMRIYNDRHQIQHILNHAIELASDSPPGEIRLFVFDDATENFERIALAEIRLHEQHRSLPERIRAFLTKLTGKKEPRRMRVDDDIVWHAASGILFERILDAFRVETKKQRRQRYAEVVEAWHAALPMRHGEC